MSSEGKQPVKLIDDYVRVLDLTVHRIFPVLVAVGLTCCISTPVLAQQAERADTDGSAVSETPTLRGGLPDDGDRRLDSLVDRPAYTPSALRPAPPNGPEATASSGDQERAIPDPAPLEPPVERPAPLPAGPANPEARTGFQPLGLRAGAFIVLPSVEIGIEYTDNALLAETGGRDDFIYTVQPEVRIESDWPRHSALLSLSSNHEFYDGNSTEDANEIEATGLVRIDVTRATDFNLRAGYALSQESRSSADVPDNATEEPDETTWDFAAGINHRFNRLTARLQGDFEISEFGDVDTVGGGKISNSDRDFHEVGGALRLGYEISPAVQPFVEARYSLRRHDDGIDDDGFRRDSDGYEAAAGVEVGGGPVLRGEISLGYEKRDFDDPRLDQVGGFTVDANLTWSPTRLTALRLSAVTEIEETTIAGASGAIERSLNLNLAHALTYNLTGEIGVSYVNSTFEGSSLEEDTFEIAAGLDYLLNRNAVLRARYEYENFDTTTPGSDYGVQTFSVGVKLQQ